jgi:hypothetical protein
VSATPTTITQICSNASGSRRKVDRANSTGNGALLEL